MKDEALKLASALDHWATQMDMGRKPDPKSLTRKASAELRRLQAELDAIKQAPPAAQPAPVQEPLEYWNAVEGWVKIDEVREHFDSVGCGTIYKTAGDGRVPLTAAQLAVPDAIIEAGESPDFRDGWNECRETMLQMLKARKP
jgi:hypothetical protein